MRGEGASYCSFFWLLSEPPASGESRRRSGGEGLNSHPVITRAPFSRWFSARFLASASLRSSIPSVVSLPVLCGALWLTFRSLLIHPRRCDSPRLCVSAVNRPLAQCLTYVRTDSYTLGNLCGAGDKDRREVGRDAEGQKYRQYRRLEPSGDRIDLPLCRTIRGATTRTNASRSRLPASDSFF